jgi:UDP-N-acetylmuramoyl-L-alanyl-D-glutamate--2,6-diaminopimelate ligase
LTRPSVRLRTLLAAAGLDAVGLRVCPGSDEGARPGARETVDLEAAEAGPEVTGPEVTGPEVTDPEVTDIVIASDQVSAGALFGCVPGSRADGHDYAEVAVEKGAVALLCERWLDVPVPQVEVPSVRRALGPVSAAFWAYPARAMKVVGVTGTNGKTTTCALLASIFEANGWNPGVIGTLTGERTTPEAPALQRQLAGLRDAGARAVAMEVSSHALDQGRVNGTDFSAGVFTNLSQDHLDYHHTMDAYFGSKAQLFTTAQVGVAVVNHEDPWGARLVGLLSEREVRVVTFGASDATEVVIGAHGSSFQWRGRRLELNMRGRLNVANAVAAATTAWELGIGWEAISTGLAVVPPVRGRFEAVDEGQPFDVLVDFAHTPAALGAALRAARELTAGGPGGEGAESRRVILVFGAGGNRDRAKRPIMGKVASELADVVVITSDNPRDEKPLTIIEEVANGAGGAVAPLVNIDRAQAIQNALENARAGDVVLIAGKGHETGQDFGTHVEPFDDAAVARDTLRRLRRERKPDKSGVGAR